MSLYRTILVPVDLAAPPQGVRDPVFLLGKEAERLRFVYIETLFGSAEHIQHARHQLESFSADAPCEVEVVVEYALAPAPAILRHAKAPDVDLIAMDTRGLQGLSRIVLGSTAQAVLQRSPVPVLTARPGDPEDGARPIEGGSILTVVDFTEASSEALIEAAGLAEALGGTMEVLHVVPRTDPPSQRAPKTREVLSFVRSTFQRTPYEGFGRLGAVLVESGKTGATILDVVERRGSGLLVLGTQGQRAVDYLPGSWLVDEVVCSAACPVLTVKVSTHSVARREDVAPL